MVTSGADAELRIGFFLGGFVVNRVWQNMLKPNFELSTVCNILFIMANDIAIDLRGVFWGGHTIHNTAAFKLPRRFADTHKNQCGCESLTCHASARARRLSMSEREKNPQITYTQAPEAVHACAEPRSSRNCSTDIT